MHRWPGWLCKVVQEWLGDRGREESREAGDQGCMQLDAFLQELSSAGRSVGRGRITLSARAGWGKLLEHQLVDRFEYILLLISAVLKAGATRLQLEASLRLLTLEWQGAQPLYHDGLLSSELGIGILHALKQGLLAELDGVRVGEDLALGSELPEPGSTCRLVLARRLGFGWGEVARVRERCRYAPAEVPITINGEVINPPMDLGRCAAYRVWLGTRGPFPSVGRAVFTGWPTHLGSSQVEVGCHSFSLVLTVGNQVCSQRDAAFIDRYQSRGLIVVDGVSYPLDGWELLERYRRWNFRLLLVCSGLQLNLSRTGVLGRELQELEEVTDGLLTCLGPSLDLAPLPLWLSFPCPVASREWLALCDSERRATAALGQDGLSKVQQKQPPGFEPGPPAWQTGVLPLDNGCNWWELGDSNPLA